MMNLIDSQNQQEARPIPKQAIVTGAASGIGREIACQLAAQGVTLALIDCHSDGLVKTESMIKANGGAASSFVLDTSQAQAITQIQSLIEGSLLGSVDFLINCAGISPKNEKSTKRMIWETSHEEWKKVMEVNVNGYFHSTQGVLPAMMKQGRGVIINISSLAGRRYTTIAGAAYAVSKAAVDALTRQSAGELAGLGIRVNGVAPGRIETNMSAVAGTDFNETIRQSTPVGRLGVPMDIANVVLFLLSDQASFMTGETIVVSGGRGI